MDYADADTALAWILQSATKICYAQISGFI